MTDSALALAFFLQIAVILLACRGVGWLARKIGQPPVVAEMIAGFMLGPSVFGWLAPDVHTRLFPQHTRPVLFVLSQLGVVLYMFCVGLEFRLDLTRTHYRRAIAVSLAGIVLPFVLGAALTATLLRGDVFFTAGVQPMQAMLFVGAAMSITAFPMLARIIYEGGITGTPVGTLTLAAGAADDAAAWVLLAVVAGSFTGSGWLALGALAGAILYAFLVFVVARPYLRWLARSAESHGSVEPWVLVSILATLATGAWFTDVTGIHAVFGAFLLGAAVPRGLITAQLQPMVEPLTTALLLPIFFVFSGLNTQLSLVNSAWLWWVAGVTFAAACVGKALGCGVAARLSGATPREALAVGVLMNARGLMELILLNIGLQLGLITPTLFTILVVMAIATTLMAGPLFAVVWRSRAGTQRS